MVTPSGPWIKNDPQKKPVLECSIKVFFTGRLKAAKSAIFDLLILEIKFLFFKNAVKILKFR